MTSNLNIYGLNFISDFLKNEKKSGLTTALMNEFSVSRPTATKFISQLIESNFLEKTGKQNRPLYQLGTNRKIYRSYKIDGIDDESTIYLRDFKGYLQLPKNIQDIFEIGFTEMINNAIDHSCGSRIEIAVGLIDGVLMVRVSDDGIGVFKKIQDALNLPSPELSIIELTKGKLKTGGKGHSGIGIFITSKMFDAFEIDANNLTFMHIDNKPDVLKDMSVESGTNVYMLIHTESSRTANEVYEKYFTSDSPESDAEFNVTNIPVRIAYMGNNMVSSRSQGKRLVTGLQEFKTVYLDFEGIDLIGQAFADEVFRVFYNSHPEVEIIPINCSDSVHRMISLAKSMR